MITILELINQLQEYPNEACVLLEKTGISIFAGELQLGLINVNCPQIFKKKYKENNYEFEE